MAENAKYRQVADWIQERLLSGELKPGDRLESENELGARFGISRQTVRHALDALEWQGILLRRRGSGTYIRARETGKAAVKSENQDDRADVRLTGDFGRAMSGGALQGEVPAQPQRELSHTVTVISTFVDGYIFPGILQSMVATLERFGYGARIMFTNNRLETERRLLVKLLEEDSRDPLIVEPVMSGLPNPNLAYYRRLQERGIPILFFNSYYPELAIPHVSMDDTEAGRAAADYLIGQGHAVIGGIFKNDDGQGRRRYKGYLKALIAAGIKAQESRVCWIDTYEMEHFEEAFPRICRRLEGCTACVCYNDQIAHMLTVEYRKRGVQIPDGISLVSFDNSELARLNPVPLTSVSHPIEILGARVAENMIRLISDPGFEATYEFEAQLEVRDSVVCRKHVEEL